MKLDIIDERIIKIIPTRIKKKPIAATTLIGNPTMIILRWHISSPPIINAPPIIPTNIPDNANIKCPK